MVMAGRMPYSVKDPDPVKLTASEFFKMAGFSRHVDIDYNGNAEFNLDLGRPIPKELKKTADFIYDGGTVEHIPNIIQSLINVVDVLKIGGIVFQVVPVNCYGDSYYNIDPLILRDFYTANGLEVLDCKLSYNTNFWVRLAAFYRRFAPSFAVDYVKRRNSASKSKLSRNEYSWIDQKLIGDELRSVKYIEPFNAKTQAIAYCGGLPARTHTNFIAIKRKEVVSFNYPCQEIYPSITNANGNSKATVFTRPSF